MKRSRKINKLKKYKILFIFPFLSKTVFILIKVILGFDKIIDNLNYDKEETWTEHI